MNRGSDGFTLIEVLLIMVILGILATIVVFGTGVFTTTSKDSACKANAKILNIAEAAYAAQHPGSFARGDTSKLVQYFTEPIPTTGTGAVKWDSAIGAWDCA